MEQLRRRLDELKDSNRKIAELESRSALVSQEVMRLNEVISARDRDLKSVKEREIEITNENNRYKVEIEQFRRRIDELGNVNRKVSEYESRIAITSQEINRLNEKVTEK